MKAPKSNLILFLPKPSLTNLRLFLICTKLFPYKYRKAIPPLQIVFFDSRIQQ